ncbi:MAG TPA: MgtC/SapB family protein [Actinocrinis sp.]|nr:MgtC/SapB family protein [Actinocrinis sp.]
MDLIIRVAVGWGLTFVLGFERAVRGASAGDRTFSLIGAGTALIGALALVSNSPAVLGGAVTGIGFIGGGLCFRQAMSDHEVLHGVTTAASIFAAAAIGAAAGIGELRLAAAATLAVLLSLEIRHIPIFRILDARRWTPYFNHDDHKHFSLRTLEAAIMHGQAESVERAEKAQAAAAASTAAEPALTAQAEQTAMNEVVADQVVESAGRGGR